MKNQHPIEISTVIPVYLDTGLPFSVFERTLNFVLTQSSLPKEIIISDDSSSFEIPKFLEKSDLHSKVNILYFRNPGAKGVSSNSNYAASQASGSFLHFLHSDDSLVNPDAYLESIGIISSKPQSWILMSGKTNGLITIPDISQMNLFGVNSIGGPSSILIAKSIFEGFDEKLSMLMDIEFVSRTAKKYGEPILVTSVCIDYGFGDWQIQRNVDESRIKQEFIYMSESGIVTKNDLFQLMAFRGVLDLQRTALRVMRLHAGLAFADFMFCLVRIKFLEMQAKFSRLKAILAKY